MVVRKRNVSFDPDVARAAEKAAAEAGKSFSAWLNDAAKQQLRIESGLAAVAEWEAEHGELTAEELRKADEALDALLAEGRHKRAQGKARSRGAPGRPKARSKTRSA